MTDFWNTQKLSLEQAISKRLFIERFWIMEEEQKEPKRGAKRASEIWSTSATGSHLVHRQKKIVINSLADTDQNVSQPLRRSCYFKGKSISFKTELQSHLTLWYSELNQSSPADKYCAPNERNFYLEPSPTSLKESQKK